MNELSEDKSTTERTGKEMVPKELYDQLLAKYQNLLQEKDDEQKGDENNKAEAEAETAQIKNELQNTPLAETVSLAAGKTHEEETPPVNKAAGNAAAAAPVQEKVLGSLQEQVKDYKVAKEAFASKNYLQALKGMQALEKSTSAQIRVRAKYYMGEILMEQGEIDLASQVFEDIVKNYGFSSYVLKSLHHLVECSSKLNQTDKTAKYTSMLKDIFGESV